MLIAYSAYIILPKNYERMNYQKSSAYKTYNYIKNNLTMDDKVAHDHMVAVPSSMQKISCHFWQGCGTDYIDEFKPNFVMLDKSFSFITPSKETQRLLKYVKDNNMVLIGTIGAEHGNVVDKSLAKENKNEIAIYKKH